MFIIRSQISKLLPRQQIKQKPLWMECFVVFFFIVLIIFVSICCYYCWCGCRRYRGCCCCYSSSFTLFLYCIMFCFPSYSLTMSSSVDGFRNYEHAQYLCVDRVLVCIAYIYLKLNEIAIWLIYSSNFGHIHWMIAWDHHAK